jgi:hypothetical protein
MIKEPESRFPDCSEDRAGLFHHYVVEHDGVQYNCNTTIYASYLAEKFNAKIWAAVLKKFVKPYIGVCKHCVKRSEIHFVDGNRGSFPPEDDTFACGRCDSVYNINEILMETGAYKR